MNAGSDLLFAGGIGYSINDALLPLPKQERCQFKRRTKPFANFQEQWAGAMRVEKLEIANGTNDGLFAFTLVAIVCKQFQKQQPGDMGYL